MPRCLFTTRSTSAQSLLKRSSSSLLVRRDGEGLERSGGK